MRGMLAALPRFCTGPMQWMDDAQIYVSCHEQSVTCAMAVQVPEPATSHQGAPAANRLAVALQPASVAEHARRRHARTRTWPTRSVAAGTPAMEHVNRSTSLRSPRARHSASPPPPQMTHMHKHACWWWCGSGAVRPKALTAATVQTAHHRAGSLPSLPPRTAISGTCRQARAHAR